MKTNSTEAGLTVLIGGAIVILLTLVVGMAIGDAFAGRASATWAAIAAILAGLAAVAQAAFAAIALASLRYNRIAAEAANETLRHQQVTAERQLRAYLARDTCPVGELDAHGRRRFDLVFTNRGQTPVFGGVSRIRCARVKRHADANGEAYDDWTIKEIGAIGPGDPLIIRNDLSCGDQAQDHANDWLFEFQVTYRDAFGQERETNGGVRIQSRDGAPIVWNEAPDRMT